MVFNKKLGTTFREGGENYHNSRPDYPSELMRDIIQFSKINKNSKILDVGCGTGKSILPLIEKGYKNIVGIDISDSMLNVARKLMPNNQFHNISFEDFTSPEQFDLILFGTSIHWINNDVVYKKVKELLKSGGTIAIFWGHHTPEKSKFVEGLKNIYEKNSHDYPSDFKDALTKICERIKNTSGLGSSEIKKYSVIEKYNEESLLALINSWSWVISLKDSQKQKLFSDIRDFIKEYKEPYSLYREYSLVMAKKS
jgi:SAM-dependent methyltransferase